jgi:hypothetical protein
MTRAPAACHPERNRGISLQNHRDPSTSLRFAQDDEGEALVTS